MVEIYKITDAVNYIDGLKVILFDLDDTLYGEKEYVRSGYRAVAKILLQICDAEDKLWRAFEQKRSAIDAVLTDEQIFTEELKQKCISAYRYHKPDIHLYDGVKEMLAGLREQGYYLGIITDGRPEGQRAKIESLELEKYVDHIIVTDELGGIEWRKPNKKAFVMMKEHFGVEFDEMCYIGDNSEKDFIAPNMLNMRSIHFANQEGIYK